MIKCIALLLILNITSSTTRQRLKRNSEIEFNYSSVAAVEYPIVHHFEFSQRLNHFLFFDDRRWSQRYAVTVTYYRKHGPAFLFLSGARSMDPGYEFSNYALTYAKNLNAICFSLEHRFYGRSRPVNESIINYLSTAQALADIANFIQGVTTEFHLSKDVEWIVFGCSYAGSLAAWSRLKYPHLIHAAVASSATILAQVDYYEYEQIVEESLKSYDSKCLESITIAFEEIAHLDDSTQNMKNISKMFYLGDDVDKDITSIKISILHIMLGIISNAVQNNDIDPISIPVVCRIMTEYNGTKALAEIRKMDMKRKEGDLKTPCEKSQEGQIEEREEAWNYQRCSELGHFSSYTNTTFLSPVKDFFLPIEMDIIIRCKPFFGPNVENLTEKISHTNSQYGGLDFNINNTIFIHGSFDPWYKAGLYKKKSNASLYETIFIKGASHCADTYLLTNGDIPELTNARNKVLRTLKSWLKENPRQSAAEIKSCT